jgi:L-fucose isomerase-like protein
VVSTKKYLIVRIGTTKAHAAISMTAKVKRQVGKLRRRGRLVKRTATQAMAVIGSEKMGIGA